MSPPLQIRQVAQLRSTTSAAARIFTPPWSYGAVIESPPSSERSKNKMKWCAASFEKKGFWPI
jgi:hypothetical protein